ncbi:hypothetical protein [Microbispora sp. NBRC 16548]|uniref:hypothetical protein n=1 Tax=Microbispora sp. NBRC 16548 TaxID=3030994 RepID=UPI0024A3A6A7|nr:hypothetical protein [Microbispora sp. NBRC 16548]GLX09381.1 hypothetical protein Misp03_63070 [Microbispora sp. NBRC 16548]
MDFWGTVLVVFRRWFVTLPAFALAVGVTIAVYMSIPVTYTSTTVLVLTTPTTGGSLPSNPKYPNGLTNPLLNFDRGLSMTASILIGALATPETAAALGASPEGDPSYEVNNGSTNPELLAQTPFVFITGESASPAAARDIVMRVEARARKILAERQEALKAPRATFIRIDRAVPATMPEPQKGRKMRSAAVALALGAAATLVAAFAAESIAQAMRVRKGRKVRKAGGAADAEPYGPSTVSVADRTRPRPSEGRQPAVSG